MNRPELARRFEPADRAQALLALYAGAERMRLYPHDRDALVDFMEDDHAN